MNKEDKNNELIYEMVLVIRNELKKDENVVNCNDKQCDNEDCVLWMAVEQYIKYN